MLSKNQNKEAIIRQRCFCHLWYDALWPVILPHIVTKHFPQTLIKSSGQLLIIFPRNPAILTINPGNFDRRNGLSRFRITQYKVTKNFPQKLVKSFGQFFSVRSGHLDKEIPANLTKNGQSGFRFRRQWKRTTSWFWLSVGWNWKFWQISENPLLFSVHSYHFDHMCWPICGLCCSHSKI